MDTRATETTRRTARAALALGAAVAVAVGVLALVHEGTSARVAATERAQRLAYFDTLLGGARHDNDLLADRVLVHDPELLGTDERVPVYRARREGQPVAAIIASVAPDGYSGAIRLLVAIAADGRLLGVRVVAHKETPGLGDAIDERKSDWIHGFAGRSLASPPPPRWTVRKDGGDFDQFTGATVTPRAVIQAVYRTLQYFERHEAEIFAAPSPPPASGATGDTDSTSR
jgi:electron transport complex protein RnfG